MADGPGGGAPLTLTVPPALWPVVRATGLLTATGTQMLARRIADEASLALTLWTPILAAAAAVAGRRRLRRAGRSYGTAAVLAATSALCLLSARSVSWTVLYLRPRGSAFPPLASIVPAGLTYCAAAEKLVDSALDAAAAAVVASWSMLALTKTGRRPSGLLEGLCLAVGLLWILWYIGRDFLLGLLF